jgi:hypothetical protein
VEYERKHGHRFDFSTVCWRPPMSPQGVVESERRQSERRFDLDALVSLTDHDTIRGPRELRAAGHFGAPLSFEWSVPFEDTLFHLGVHAISPTHVDEIESALNAYSTRGAGALAELLDTLGQCPDTLVVVNHPLWDLRRIGQLRHEATLLSFLRRHRDRVHALELNGYRTWTENRRVLSLAGGFGVPLVGGGDRHGYSPNAIINLTHATTFSEFAHEVRHGTSHCVVMPEYAEPFISRVLETVHDVLRKDARAARGWQDRVFVEVNGRATPVSTAWKRVPVWIHACAALMGGLNSAPARLLFSLIRADGARTLHADVAPVPVATPVPSTSAQPSAAA